MDRWVGRPALVTGASAGIGAALVRVLVKNGMKVAACARNFERLQALKEELKNEKGSVLPIKCDVRDTDALEAMFKTIKKEYGGVDLCINNAGLGYDAPLLTGSNDQFREMMETNVLALTICTRESVQSMKERGVDDGYIFHISSLSGHRIEPFACGHFYAATKHAVKALTEGLRAELRSMNSHTRVTAISPGNVATEFTARMYAHDPELQAKKVIPDIKELDTKDIVDAVLHALYSPPHVQIHDILIRPTEQDT